MYLAIISRDFVLVLQRSSWERWSRIIRCCHMYLMASSFNITVVCLARSYNFCGTGLPLWAYPSTTTFICHFVLWKITKENKRSLQISFIWYTKFCELYLLALCNPVCVYKVESSSYPLVFVRNIRILMNNRDFDTLRINAALLRKQLFALNFI